MYIEEYTTYQESEVLALYGSVGWTAYTEQPEALRRGFAGSLLTLASRENGTLVGLLRAVGDGCTVVLVQDLLVRPDHQRRGIGTALMQAALERFRSVRQVQLLCSKGAIRRMVAGIHGRSTATVLPSRMSAPGPRRSRWIRADTRRSPNCRVSV